MVAAAAWKMVASLVVPREVSLVIYSHTVSPKWDGFFILEHCFINLRQYLCENLQAFLKFIVATILLLSFAAQTFTKDLIILDYYTNTAAYEKDCVNKDKPMMHCCGRCQLKKRLQQEENNEKQNAEERSANKNQTLSSRSFFATVPLAYQLSYSNNYPQLSCGKEIKMPRSFFHPPGA
jgi:hypothetical protein